ncbi:MAG: alpha-D-ribose 1-methylphosphonate 5-triphosphate diphosphatase [Alphaproteobacteria bacterium]|nr:alpha-D-ribose 1-methylphosphonate 5-triphosphate diphosphatase [Alphaproteobacteria bacterium]
MSEAAAAADQLRAVGLHKSFTLHNQGGRILPVLEGVGLTVAAGECVVLDGPSGIGKSTLLRALYGNYLVQQGQILVRHREQVVDIARAPPRVVLDVRCRTLGFVSQFLRVIPRLPTLDLVAEPLRRLGVECDAARQRAEQLLERLAIPRRLWDLPPATFSGGEQQRVNIARALAAGYPILLLDEPTAALDPENRTRVLALIEEERRRGAAIIAVFHDPEVRETAATRCVRLAPTEATRAPRRGSAQQPAGELVLTNARIVGADSVVDGTAVVQDHRISAVEAGQTGIAGAIDFGGDYLLPGLIELHTDNLEKHVAPRPGVRWPMSPAVLAHDAQIAAAGITTVLDALTVGEVRQDGVRAEMLHAAVAAISSNAGAGMLRVEHFLHLRCEVAHETVAQAIEELIDHPRVKLLSLMDHTPGQRQFASMDKYYQYYQGKFGYTDAEMAAYVAEKIEANRRFADDNRRTLAALGRSRGLPQASHDDATPAHVAEAVSLGVTIAEFPTTAEAAEAAHRSGLAIVMGAPNLVRGGSHSGNISARDMAADGRLDILSSDYAPVSLLHAAFLLHFELGMALPPAIATVSLNPARALGLADRGCIARDARADLIRVRVVDGLPVVRQVWRAGERVV